MEFFLLGLILLFMVPKGRKAVPPTSRAIIGYGRSPLYLDIMEEEMAPLKAKLEEDARNGVIYQKRRMTLQQLLNNEEGEEYEESAADALRDFERYVNRGYM